MKNILMIFCLAMLFFSCEESTTTTDSSNEPIDIPTDGSATWSDYLTDVMHKDYIVKSSYASMFFPNDTSQTYNEFITELEEGYNIIGVKRGPVDKVSSYIHMSFGFAEAVYDDVTSDVYYTFEDGKDVEPGTISDPGFNGGSNKNITYDGSYVTIRLRDGITGDQYGNNAIGKNANLQIGDEIAKVTIYADANHNSPIETFSLIL